MESHLDTAENGTYSVGGGLSSRGSVICSIEKTNTLPYAVEDLSRVAVRGIRSVSKNIENHIPSTRQNSV